jgi:hypothetical protein
MPLPEPAVTRPAATRRPTVPLSRRIGGYIEDIGLLIVILVALPVTILIIGAPLALLARLVTFVSERW